MADRADTFATVAGIIAKQLGVPREQVTEESTLESLGADSLDRVEIIMDVEEALDIDIDDEVAEKFSILRQAVDYMHGLRK